MEVQRGEVAGATTGALTSTTISTIAVQTGKTRIVLAVLKHKNDLHLRIQEMEPPITEVGRTLEEALELQKEHNECLAKLLAKQPNVEELLAQADELISTQQPKREVYGAMADSLGQAWRDLNDLLEYRRLLLERAVDFHKQVSECNEKIANTQKTMEKDMGSYTGSARDWLREHETVRKDILESSIRLLGEAQSLVDHINDLGRIPAADSRGYKHATSSACYVVESLLENVHDRRRRLEELWQRRRADLLVQQKLKSLRHSMEQLLQLYQKIVEMDKRFTTLGLNLTDTHKIISEHETLEQRVKELYDLSHQLQRLHAQISPCPPEDDRDFQVLVDRVEKIHLQVDRRRFLFLITKEFYEHVEAFFHRLPHEQQTLSDMEKQKQQIKPEDIISRQRDILENLKAFTSPIIHEAHMIMERAEQMDASGVEGALQAIQEMLNRLELQCSAFQSSMARRSENYRKFTEIYTELYEWTTHVVEVLLKSKNVLPTTLNGIRDFLDVHEQVYDEMKSKENTMFSLIDLVSHIANDPAGLDSSELAEITRKTDHLKDRWSELSSILTSRLEIVSPYSDFQKTTQKVSSEIEVLQSLSGAVQADSGSDVNANNFDQRLASLHSLISNLQTKASDFFNKAGQAGMAQVDVGPAAQTVNSTLEKLQQDLRNFAQVTQQLNETRQKKAQWREYVEEVTTTVTYILKTEREVFDGMQLGYLGTSQQEAQQLQNKVNAFEPVITEVRTKVDKLVEHSRNIPIEVESTAERDTVVNDLIKTYERFSKRIEEYKVLLNMSKEFYSCIEELDRLMKEYESMIRQNPPTQTTETRHYHEYHEKITHVYEVAVNLGDNIVNRIRQTHPQNQVNLDTFQSNIRDKKDDWERRWTQQNQDVQHQMEIMKLKNETDELRQKIKELTDQMNRRKEETVESLQSAKRLHEVHTTFIKTVEVINVKVQNFVSTVEKFISAPENAAQMPELQKTRNEVEKLWSTFHRDVQSLTKRTELTVQFFEVLEEAEQWFKEATQALVTIGRKTTECRGPEDANNVITQLEGFLGPGEKKQEQRVRTLLELSLQVFGREGPKRVEYLSQKNKDVMDSFAVISNELFSIAENLHSKVVKSTRAKSSEESDLGQPPAKAQKTSAHEHIVRIEQTDVQKDAPPVAQKPQPVSFTEPLQDIEARAGQSVTLYCQAAGIPSPMVRWLRDGLPVSNNPRYVPDRNLTSGECSMTITECFPEDTGVFTCCAENPSGMVTTEGRLIVHEAKPRMDDMTPPVFLKTPQDAVAVEGSGLQFECQVIGNPKPDTAWYKNGQQLYPNQSKIVVIPPDEQGVTKIIIPNAGVEDQGTYECKATNPRGVATCSISFSSKNKSGEEPPYFTQLLAPVVPNIGDLVKLECHVNGVPVPDLEWTLNNQVLHDSRNRVIKFDGKVATLVVFEFSKKDEGIYGCKARNKLGEATTSCSVLPQVETIVTSVPHVSVAPPVREPRHKEPSPVAQAQPDHVVYTNAPVERPDSSMDTETTETVETITEVYNEPEETVQPQEVPKAKPERRTEILLPLPLDLDAEEGQTITLETIIQSEPEAPVQWLKNGNIIVANVDIIMGKKGVPENPHAQHHYLTITNPTVDHSGEYVCVVQTRDGDVASLTLVNVKEKTAPPTAPKPSQPSFKPEFSQPLPIHVESNNTEPVSLETVVRAFPDAEVVWLKDDVPLQAGPSFDIQTEVITTSPQVEKHRLIMNNPEPGRYTCKAKNEQGEASTVALIKVHLPAQPRQVPAEAAGKISVPEQRKTPETDADTSSKVPPPTATKPAPTTEVLEETIETRTTTDQEVPLARPIEERQVSNTQPTPNAPEYERTDIVRLEETKIYRYEEPSTTLEPPRFSELLVDHSVEEGAMLRLICNVQGTKPLAIKWFKDEVEIPDNADYVTRYDENTGQCVLEIPEVFAEDAGVFQIQATNEAGIGKCYCNLRVADLISTSETEGATQPLVVSRNPPQFVELFRDQKIEQGQPVVFTCVIAGDQPKIQWFKDGMLLTPSHDYDIKSEGQRQILIIPQGKPQDSGHYVCQADSPFGKATCSAQLSVQPLSKTVTAQPQPFAPWKTQQEQPVQETITERYEQVTTTHKIQPAAPAPFTVPQPVPFVPKKPAPVADQGPVNLALSTPDHLRNIGQNLEADEILTHERPYIPGEPLDYRPWNHVAPDLQYSRQVPQPVVEKSHGGKPYQPKPVPQQEQRVPSGQWNASPTQPTMAPQYRPSPPPVPDRPRSQDRFPSPVRLPSPVRPSSTPVALGLSGPDGMPLIGQNVNADQHLFHERPYIPGQEYAPAQGTIIPYKQEKFPSGLPQVPMKPAHRITQPNVPSETCPPSFPRKLCSKGVRPGEPAIFEVQVSGVPQPSVTWYHENIPLQQSPRTQIVQRRDLHQLTIAAVNPDDTGKIKVRAVNPAGEGICIADLVVLEPNQFIREAPIEETFFEPPVVPQKPRPAQQAHPLHFVRELSPILTNERSRAVLECAVDASEPFNVNWYRNDIKITPSRDYQQKITHGVCTLTIPEVYPEDSGLYTCEVVSPQGSRRTTTFVTVEPSAPASGPSAPKITPKTSQSPSVPFEQETRPKKPKIQSSNIAYRGAVSDHSDVEFGESAGIYSPLTPRPVQRPVRGTSLGPDHSPNDHQPSESVDEDINMNGWAPSGMEPPRFLQILAPTRAFEGGEAHLHARVTGNPLPVVTWLKNGSLLPASSQRHAFYQDGDHVGLSIRMALREDSGNYTLVAENPVGQDSCSATVTVEEKQRRSLSRQNSDGMASSMRGGSRPREMSNGPRGGQPEEETYDKSMAPRFVAIPSDAYVREGQLVRLDCRVSGRPYPDVKWYKNGGEVVDDWTHKLLVNEGGGHALMITNPSVDDNGQYVCVAKNISGEVYFTVTISVEPSDKTTAPSFVQKLVNKQAHQGESVTFQARAVGMPAPTMTWHKGAREIFSGERYRIDTHNGASTLNIDNVAVDDSDWYQCHARNSAGTTVTKAKLAVEAPPRDLVNPGGFFVPRVGRKPAEPEPQPELVYLRPFSRPAPPPPSYVSSAPVDVSNEKPAFTTLLNDLELYEGERARFESCLIPIGDGTLRVEWYKNGVRLQEDSRHLFNSNFGFVSLDIISLRQEDKGVYTIRAINAAGEAVTTATLHVHPRQPLVSNQFSAAQAMPVVIPQQVQKPQLFAKPQFSRQLKNIDGARENSVAVFEAQIEPADDQLMRVEWFRNGQAIQLSERFDMKYLFGRAVLTIKNLRTEDAGVYVVKASNGAGEARSTATLHVEPEVQRGPTGPSPSYRNTTNTTSSFQNVIQRQTSASSATSYNNFNNVSQQNTYQTNVNTILTAPTFMRHLESDYNVLEGSRLHMEVRAEPAQGQDLQFTWMKNGKPVISDHRVRTSFAEGYASIDILTVYPEDSGVYTLRVANAAGEAFTSTTLHVIPAPQPVAQQKPAFSDSTMRVDRQISTTKTTTSANIQQQAPQPVGPPAQAPMFTQPLQNVTTKQGTHIHLETRLIPVGDSSLSVLWYKDGVPLPAGARIKTTNDWGHVALDIDHCYPEDSGFYMVRAINAAGEAAVSSRIAVEGEQKISYESSTAANLDNIKQLEDWRNRDTKPRDAAPPVAPPKMLRPLKPDHTVPESKNAHFECQIQPADGITVTWYHNGQEMKASSRIRTVADFGFVALDIIGVRPDDEGQWTCVIKNKAGQIQSDTSLSVLTEASMLLGTDNPERLHELQRLESKRATSTHEITPTVERPQFRTPLHNQLGLAEGSAVHLETRLTPISEPSQRVEWFKDGRPLLNSARIKTVTDFGFVALDISNLHTGDTGLYSVVATNAAGEAVQTCQIQVLGETNILSQSINPQSLGQIQRLEDNKGPYSIPDQEIVSQAPRFLNPLKNLDIQEDTPAHFECRLEPVNDPKLRVEWRKDGVPLKASHRYKTTYDFGYVALHIVGAQTEDNGRYSVVAYNALGRIEQAADLIVRGTKLISFESQNPEGLQKIQQLEAWRSASHTGAVDQEAPSTAPHFTHPLRANPSTVPEGNSAHFEAKVEGVDSKTTVEWFVNGRPVQQGSRFRFINEFGYLALTISDMRPEDAGVYEVRAYNDKGSDVTSTTVNVQTKKSLLTETLHPNSLNKIQGLENYESPKPGALEDRPTVQRPMFTVPLRNHEVTEGEKVHLESRLIPIGCTVEWLHNGRPVDTGSRFSKVNDFGFVALDINGVRPQDNGTYSCVARNELGEAVATCSVLVKGTESMLLGTSHPDALAKLQALENYAPEQREEIEMKYGKPVFTIPLQANMEVQEGEPVRLHCQLVPVGDPTLKVEWYLNNAPLRTGSRFLHLNQFGHVGLDLSAANAEDSGLYTCRAVNAAGEAVTSTSVRCVSKSSLLMGTLHPESLPRIRQLEEHPEVPTQEHEVEYGPPHFVTTLRNQDDVKEGTTAHFECRLEPSRDPTMKVEWFHNGAPLKAANRSKIIQDFGFVALDLSQVTDIDSGVYMVRAFNKHGEAFTSARLLCQGTKSVYSASQTSEMALQRIAQLENAQGTTFTSESKMLQSDDSGVAPHFTSAPKDLNLKESDIAHLHCNVTPANDSTLQIIWLKNGQPLPASSRIKTLNDFGFCVLEISGIQTEDSGQYTCIARNKYGEDRVSCTILCSGKRSIFLDTQHPESLEKIRRLEEPTGPLGPSVPDKPKQVPKILAPLRPLAVNEGEPAHFETRITPTDDVDMKVEWFINGRLLLDASRKKTINDFGYIALDILYTQLEDFGMVSVRVHNSMGIDETSAPLSQLGVGPTQSPRFTSSLQNVSGAKEGDSIHLQANLEPAKDPNLTVSWYRNGKPIIHGSRVKTIHDWGFVVLEISPVYAEDSGEYTCVARNQAGEAVTTASIMVEGKKGLILESQLPADMRDSSMQKIQQIESASMHTYVADTTVTKPTQPPRFVSQAHDVEVKENSMAHFELRLEPSNDNTMQIEWYHNGKSVDVGSRFNRIQDFGFIILEINAVKGYDSGTYTCVARNELGEARSDVNLKVLTSKNVVYDSSQPASLQKIQELEMSNQPLPDTTVEQPDELPRFTSQLTHRMELNEGDTAHFEARIEPRNAMVEWMRNGRPIVTGSRIRSVNDFGFVVLDISGVTAEDSGEITCRARTSVGVAETKTNLIVHSKKSIYLESQVPGGANMQRLRELEMPTAPLPEEKPVQKFPPRFITQLTQNVQAIEGNTIHIDCRVEPFDCTIEWYHNNIPLRAGHRFKMISDFGFVSLDILYVYAEDSGEYVARAVNELGEDVTRCMITVTAKESVITRTQLPEGMEKGVERLQEIERDLSERGPIPYEAPDNRKQRSKPEFTVKPRALTVKEGEPAKFECKVAGYPRPRISWMLNNELVITGSRFKISYDGLINTLEIPRTRQYDGGELAIIAQNTEGSATTLTTLTITTQSDYRTVLKHSTSKKDSVPVPDSFNTRVEQSVKNQQEGVQKVELQPVRRAPPGAPSQQPRTDQHTEQSTTMTNQWQKQQVQVPQSPPVVPAWKQQQQERQQQQQTQQYQSQQNFQMQQQQHPTQVPQSPAVQPPIAPKPAQQPSQQFNQQSTQQSSQFNSSQQMTFQQQQQQPQPQQQPPSPIQQVPATPPKPQAPASPAPPGPAWMRQTSKQEVEQPAWITSRKTPQSPTLPPKPQSPAMQQHSTSTDINMSKSTSESHRQQQQQHQQQQLQSRTQSPALPMPTGSEDLEMSANESEYTQRLQKGNVTEIRYVQQRETSESKRASVQRVVPTGQGGGPVLPTDLQAPKFTQRLEPCRVSEGKSAQFVCRFSGKPIPRIEWYRENFLIANSPDFQITTTNDTSILFVNEVYLEDSANFTVKAINEGGMSQSTANLIVEEAYSGESSGPAPPSFVDTIHDTKATAGDTIKMEAKIHGSAPISVSWFKNGQKLNPSHRIKFLRQDDIHQLLVLDSNAEDSGWLDCVASNEGGEARCSAQLSVEGANPSQQVPQRGPVTTGQITRPEVTQVPQNVTVYEGESATFRATVAGTPQPEVKWYKGSNLIKNSKYFRTFVSGNQCTLVITEAFCEDEGEYRMVARSPAGEATCAVFLKVTAASSSSHETTVRILTHASHSSHVISSSSMTTTSEVAELH